MKSYSGWGEKSSFNQKKIPICINFVTCSNLDELYSYSLLLKRNFLVRLIEDHYNNEEKIN